jgi:hypothetical protein
MIRFSPDSPLEAVLRPVLMALPQGWIYTEIMAPDFRFLMLILLLATIALSGIIKKRTEKEKNPYQLNFAILMLPPAFAIWLATGGNGRYFMPFLVLVGPILIATLYWTNWRRGAKRGLLLIFAVAQLLAISTNPPWKSFDSLAWGYWREAPYFSIENGSEKHEQAVTYLTFSGQTYSLVAPMFPSSSSWVNLGRFAGNEFIESKNPIVVSVRKKLQRSKSLQLFIVAQPRRANQENGLPSIEVLRIMGDRLGRYGLIVPEDARCKLFRSSSMAGALVTSKEDTSDMLEGLRRNSGFWACEVVYSGVKGWGVGEKANSTLERRVQRVFETVERQCPRLFPPGQKALTVRRVGFSRSYSVSDATLTYLISSGEVQVKFLRALNPQRIGSEREIESPEFKLKCDSFVSREGLPWLRTL